MRRAAEVELTGILDKAIYRLLSLKVRPGVFFFGVLEGFRGAENPLPCLAVPTTCLAHCFPDSISADALFDALSFSLPALLSSMSPVQ